MHQVRNTLKYVSDKDRKEFAADLKKIYNAPNEQLGAEARDEVTEKWNAKYPNAMKSWYKNWDAITVYDTLKIPQKSVQKSLS